MNPKLFQKAMRLAEAAAKRAYRVYGPVAGSRLELEDLTQVAYLGLLKAAERTDQDRPELEQLSYTRFYVAREISKYVCDNLLVCRIPLTYKQDLDRLLTAIEEEAEEQLAEQLEEEAEEQLAEQLNMPEKWVSRILKLMSVQSDAGIDAVVESVEDEVIEEVFNEQLTWMLKTLFRLAKLSPTTTKVLELRYGLEDGVPRTLTEVGAEFHVTGARVHQLEAKGLRDIRYQIVRDRGWKDYIHYYL